LLAFSLSFDDYIITNFNASPSSITFPMYVWGSAQRGAPVQVNVIGTLMFLLALAVVVVGQVLVTRRERARA
ncbi:MAG: ABC transporter permease, partial [Phycicoccus sp.]